VAAAQVLIYVGAVNVLILFAIMLVNKREDFPSIRNAWVAQHRLLCRTVCPLEYDGVGDTVFNRSNPGNSSIIVIGQHFFTDFAALELASILLLMVGKSFWRVGSFARAGDVP